VTTLPPLHSGGFLKCSINKRMYFTIEMINASTGNRRVNAFGSLSDAISWKQALERHTPSAVSIVYKQGSEMSRVVA
jgi:hypothetical protein